MFLQEFIHGLEELNAMAFEAEVVIAVGLFDVGIFFSGFFERGNELP